MHVATHKLRRLGGIGLTRELVIKANRLLNFSVKCESSLTPVRFEVSLWSPPCFHIICFTLLGAQPHISAPSGTGRPLAAESCRTARQSQVKTSLRLLQWKSIHQIPFPSTCSLLHALLLLKKRVSPPAGATAAHSATTDPLTTPRTVTQLPLTSAGKVRWCQFCAHYLPGWRQLLTPLGDA